MNFGTRGCMYCEDECNKECLLQEEPKAEKMYSEEDMHKLMDEYQDYLFKTTEPVKTFKDWLEQIKKK